MSKKIFTVGFEVPGDDDEQIAFRSDQSLLDAEGSPVKSRLVPSDCRFVTKPIYPAKSLAIRDSVKYAQPATTNDRPAGSSHLIEAFHAKATYGRRGWWGECVLVMQKTGLRVPEGRNVYRTSVLRIREAPLGVPLLINGSEHIRK